MCFPNKKRVVVATLLGLLAGIVCYFGGLSAGVSYTTEMMLSTILDRTLIGFVIGISAIEMNYLLHGALIGALITWPISVYGGMYGFNILMAFGIAYGILIEFITTNLLKLPAKATEKKKK